MAAQDEVIDLLSEDLGNGSTASFDLALLERLTGLLSEYSEPDFQCSMLGAPSIGGPVSNTGRGIEGMREVVGDWLDTFESLRAEQIGFERVGDGVVMNVVQIATSHGVEISTPSSIVFQFSGERINAIEFHLDQQAARESARGASRS